jgi:hypothetical protein
VGRSITIDAGQRTRVIRRRFNSVPSLFEFTVDAARPGETVSGIVERVGSRWILGRTRDTLPLEPLVGIHKGFWDTLFDVYVTPAVDVVVTAPQASLRSRRLIIGVAAIITIVAVTIALSVAGR